MRGRYEPMSLVFRRHYHPESETFTGVDSLLSAVEAGWRIASPAYMEIYPRNGRYIYICRMRLVYGTRTMEMSVLVNPYFPRLMRRFPVHVLEQAMSPAKQPVPAL